MPTGYTAAIEEGATFKQFVLGCAKAFGPCIDLKDASHETPIPEKFEPETYAFVSVREATADLERLQAMSLAECSEKSAEEFKAHVAQIHALIRQRQELKAKYDAMREQAEAWEPPTADHIGLREFMLQQIDYTAPKDSDIEWYQKQKPVQLSGAAWRKTRIAEAKETIARNQEAAERDAAEYVFRNAWVAALRASLEDLSPVGSSK